MRMRLTAAALTVAIFSVQSAPALALRFADAAGSGYEKAIETLSGAGIIGGYPDGTVGPYYTLNRAEALKIILNLRSSTKNDVERMKNSLLPIPLFRDVDQKAWYAPYVEVGFDQGIVKGYPDGTFKPGNTLTVEEAVTLLMRTYGESATQFRTASSLQNKQNEWFTPYVSAAHVRNAIGSRETLKLGNPVTRGQFFDMAYRMREVKMSGLVAYTETAADRAPVGGSSVPQRPTGQAGSALQFASSKDFAITLPTLGIRDLTITHPDDPFTSKGVLSVLDTGVGHLFSYPGEGGKIMIYGHSSGYPWDISEYTKIFRRINELKNGDRAYVTFNRKLYVYEVTRHQTVHAEDTTPFDPDGKEEMILFTCWPPDSVDERYLVHLKPVESFAL